MTLLEVITNAAANNEAFSSQSDYPIVLNPDDIFLNLKPAIDEPHPASLVTPVTGWKLSKRDSELVESSKKFYKLLSRKLKDTNNFDKNEFIQILNPFLEKSRDKVGISVAIDSSHEMYTQVLVEKVGFLMGKDVVRLVLEGCISLEMWELVESLIVNSLVDRSCYSYLVLSLVVKRRSDLLCLCIKHAPDLGITDLLCILKYFLYPPRDACSTIAKVKKEWENQALLAIEKASDKALTGKKSLVARDASILLMMAYDEFLASELCLHYLLASSNLDEVVLSSAISKLNGEEMGNLLVYLAKWLKKFERFPQAVPCREASSLLGLKACDWVPKLEDIVKFLGLVLDENYISLVLQPDFHEKLRFMAELVNSLSAEAKSCCSVAYVVENVKTEVKGP